jgi:hypothetical protein
LARSSAARLFGIEQHEERPVRQQAPRHEEVQLAHLVLTEPAPDSLIGNRRVDVAVTDDVLTTLERGPDRVLDMIGASGGIQRRLRPGRHVVAVQDDLAHCLCDRRAAGLPRQEHVPARFREPTGKQGGLGALARPVDSFKGHEHRAPNVRGQCGRS